MSIATKIIQYNTNGATFSVQKQLVITTVSTGYTNIESGGGGGVTAHSALTGLGNDDHTQYHNDARGDIRYYTKTELDAGQLDTRYYTQAEVAAGYQPLDSILTNTTASFTIVLESKLAGIDAGATKNYSGTSTVSFGATETNEAQLVVTGQTGIGAGAKPIASIGTTATADYTANDHKYLGSIGVSVTTGNVVAGTGFTIYVRSYQKLKGDISINWVY